MSNIVFTQFLQTAKKEGFEIILEVPFVGHWYGAMRQEMLVIMWHKDGILLKAESYSDALNTADIYFNFAKGDGNDSIDFISGGGAIRCHSIHENIYIIDKDVRVNFSYYLHEIRKHGKFLTKWVERPFLWLLHYMSIREENGQITNDYDYKLINAQRISCFPKHVIDAITP